MADKWISSQTWERLSYEERENYLRSRIEDVSETECDDENESNIITPGDQEDDVPITINEDDPVSDEEERNLPEFIPEDESSDIDIIGDELTEEPVEQPNPMEYKARDGTVWSEIPPLNRRTLLHNILKSAAAEPANKTRGLSIIETFKLFISAEICDIIIRETNRRGAQSYKTWNDNHPDNIRVWKPINESEFDGYLGIIIFAGVSRSKNEHILDLWRTSSHLLYRATMGVQRFYTISRYIRFDNGNTRAQRLLSDKAAAISDIWLMLNRNLRECFVAGPNVTVDEQLFPYRGGTRFTQYIPSKPARYGIKVWWVCDSTTSYPIKGQIYTGTAPNSQRETNQGERVVKDLCCTLFRGSGRNITRDNFFTSYSLASSLMRDYNLSILGTVNKRRRFVPAEFLIEKGKPRPVESSFFGFSNNITMCSYIPKKNKAVVVLSTMHYDKETQGPANKPTMILDYNKTKGGVDNMDKMLGEYSCKRKTNRWPLAFFYNIMDVAALAAHIVYVENNPSLKKNCSHRRKFLQQLCEQLVMPEINERSKNPQIMRHFSTKNGIESMFGHTVDAEIRVVQSASSAEKRDASGRIIHKGNCYLCSKRRPTRKNCANCKKPVCAQHTLTVATCVRCTTTT